MMQCVKMYLFWLKQLCVTFKIFQFEGLDSCNALLHEYMGLQCASSIKQDAENLQCFSHIKTFPVLYFKI